MRRARDLLATDRIVRRQDLLAAPIDDELTLMDIDTGHYFGMNAMATRIWAMVETPRTLADLCSALTESFDVDEDTCRTHVIEFVAAMATQDLVTVEHEMGDGA